MSAVITDVRLAAAHEGVAEIIVSLTFSNGGRSEVALDQATAARLMQNCGVPQAEQLIGHGWEQVRDAMTGVYNGLE